MTTEQKVAREILQKPEAVTVAGRTYNVAPPSVATLILASEAVSQLPRMELDRNNVVAECLRVAKDCRKIGDVLAVLLLGAKRIREERHGLKRLLRWRKGCVEELSERLLEELSPHGMQQLAGLLLARMELADFFGLTTFLQGANMTRPTKVVKGTTASGQP